LIWKVLLEHIFEKNCSIEFINPVRPSVRLSVCPSVRLSVCPSVPYFFAIFQPTIFNFWILREEYLSTRSTAGFFDPKPRSSGMELRIGPFQIKVFSLYFINFWETINVFQLISQSCREIQIFQKKNSMEALEAAGSGSNLRFNYSHLKKQDKESFTKVVT
jgi:hypothetical protein